MITTKKNLTQSGHTQDVLRISLSYPTKSAFRSLSVKLFSDVGCLESILTWVESNSSPVVEMGGNMLSKGFPALTRTKD